VRLVNLVENKERMIDPATQTHRAQPLSMQLRHSMPNFDENHVVMAHITTG
jgi:hypothetical protein